MHSRIAVAQKSIRAENNWSGGSLGNIKGADFQLVCVSADGFLMWRAGIRRQIISQPSDRKSRHRFRWSKLALRQ
jgi:hypothetical protein